MKPSNTSWRFSAFIGILWVTIAITGNNAFGVETVIYQESFDGGTVESGADVTHAYWGTNQPPAMGRLTITNDQTWNPPDGSWHMVGGGAASINNNTGDLTVYESGTLSLSGTETYQMSIESRSLANFALPQFRISLVDTVTSASEVVIPTFTVPFGGGPGGGTWATNTSAQFTTSLTNNPVIIVLDNLNLAANGNDIAVDNIRLVRIDPDPDFGDAPDTYGTDRTAANSGSGSDPVGASHIIDSNLYIGPTVPDGEIDGFVDGTDDTGNAGDDDAGAAPGNGADEGGITLTTLIATDPSYSVDVDVVNTNNSNVTLIGWIDFDQSGTFDADEEAILTGVLTGIQTLSWNAIPPDTTVGPTFARFRLSTDSLTESDATGAASDGEVEDYQVSISTDKDNDGVSDIDDIDDDNDGILDINEGDRENVSLNKTVTGFSSQFNASEWAANNINDEVINVTTHRGWASVSGATTGRDEWVTIDPGATYSIDSFTIQNELGNNNRNIRDYVFYGSDTGTFTGEEFVISSGTIPSLLSGQTHTVDFSTVTTRYVKIQGTSGYSSFVIIGELSISGILDSDGDGVDDFCDLDSDNDGIDDLRESGSLAGISADTNSDGMISVAEAEAILGAGNADADSDGLMDIFDADTGNTDPVASAGTTPVDSDSGSGNPDGIADYRDLDSDNDGIADTIEARPTAGYTTNDGDVTDNDADSDGVVDQFDANDGTTQLFGGTFATPEDTDGDLTPDYFDTDSDDDTLLDSAESGLTLSGNDTNGDGIDDDATIGASFTDPDGVVDDPSTDLDNEVGDTTEVAYREVSDKDNDGIADARDIDDDNDGILDINEKGVLAFQNSIESTSGWNNTAGIFLTATAGLTPTAGTEFLVFNPVGFNGSRWLDTGEVFAVGTYTFLVDVGNFNNAPFPGSTFAGIRAGTTAASPGTPVTTTSMSEQIPALGQMLTWSYTLDIADGDPLIGQTIGFEVGVAGGGSSNVAFDNLRIDADGVVEQDSDSDGIDDLCDLDSDNDGISDLRESGSLAGISADTNSDGTISIAEAEGVLGAGNADADSDGLMDIFDADTSNTDPAISAGTTPVDSDSGSANPDSIADFRDLDSDNDGIADTIEARSTAGFTTNDGDVTDNDADGDGVIDQFDANDGTTQLFGGTFSTPEDTDGDLTSDYQDTNSDNDALLDDAESGLTLSGNDANDDGIDDDPTIGASYADPDGVVDDPSSDLNNQIGDTSEVGYRESVQLMDFGDAPDIYGTDLTPGNSISGIDPIGASHMISSNLYIGPRLPDGDIDGFVDGIEDTSTANDDDAALAPGNGTDEGGITLGPLATVDSSYSVDVDVVNTNNSSVTLIGWIDFDLSGTFDADEEAILNGVLVGTQTLSWNTIPSDIAVGTSYIRFRLSTDSLTENDFAGSANDGEVEDYEITIMPLTASGLCLTPLTFVAEAGEDVANGLLGWPTTSSRTFTNVANSGLDMVINTFEPNGTTPRAVQLFPEVNAIGFNAGPVIGIHWRGEISFFETGTTIPAELADFSFVLEDFERDSGTNAEKVFELFVETATGISSQVNFQTGTTITTFSGTPVFENGGLTLDGHYSFAAGTNLDRWTRVALPTNGNYHKISFALGRGNGGGNPLFGICGAAGADRGDAPPSYGSAPHEVDNVPSHFLGTIAPDVETLATFNGYPAGATGDGADEDGVVIPALTQGQTATVTATIAGAGGFLQGWIDFDGDGAFGAGEQIANDLQDDGTGDDASAGDGVITFTVSVPSNATTNQTLARFRWSTLSALNATISAPDGEVEDFALSIIESIDFGDAPDTYGTDRTDSGGEGIGASHRIDSNLYIGPTVPDVDIDGFVDGTDDTGNARDDDAAAAPGNGADESGITLTTLIATDSSYSVDIDVVNTNNSNVTLIGWIDFDQSGTFDVDEEAILTGVLTGTQTLSWNTIPPDITVGPTFARFRLSSDSLTESEATGGASDGEVEDYQVSISADKDNDGVSDIDDIDDDNDGILDINEKGALAFQNSIESTSGWSGSGGSFLTATAGLTPTAGTQFLHFNPVGAGGSRWLDTGEVFAVGTYTFQIDVGNFNNLPFPASTFAGIRAGTTAASAGTTVTATNMSEPTPGSGVMLTWSYTLDIADGNPLIGQTIGFEVGVGGGGSSNVAFDNLRIDADGVVERDSDSDGVDDLCDLDSDNDGISDLRESGSLTGISADTNSDGTISIAEAEALLGAGNADADGDGLMDIFDADTGNTDPAASVGTTPIDSDSGSANPDSIADYLDLDSDNDGIADTIEARPTAGYTTNDGDVTDNDADGDGVVDQFDANDGTTQLFGGTFTTPEDTDGDLTPDYFDTDSDDDTLLDSAESGLTLSGNDTNGDGIDDDATIGASYADPDGVVDDPSSDLDNEVGDTTEVGYREVFVPIDYGDAPACYGDASHDVDNTNYLGSLIDNDSASQPSSDALGDDSDGGTGTETINWQKYLGAFTTTANITTGTLDISGTNTAIDLAGQSGDNFGLVYTGFIFLSETGTYTFATTSDDGSRLFINGSEVVNNDGLHASQQRTGTLSLTAGWHEIEVLYFEAGGGESLSAQYQAPSAGSLTNIPGSILSATDPDDEDGVMFSPLLGGQSVLVPVTVTGSGNVNMWIDLNADCDFDDAGEQVIVDETVTAGTTNLSVTVPIDAVEGNTFARIRLGSGGVASSGPDTFGEVEDYQISIIPDKDNDGISDVDDIDGDNDGILDINEGDRENVSLNKTVTGFSSQFNASEWAANNINDGVINATTNRGWASVSGATTGRDEWVTIDLGATYSIDSFTIQNELGANNRNIMDYVFYGSDTGTFTGEEFVISSGIIPSLLSGQTHTVDFPTVTTRYVKIQGTSSYSSFVIVGELSISGKLDSDGDGVDDLCDLDSDNDGINDLHESGSLAGISADTNSDGVISVAEAEAILGAGNADADGDGLMDIFDADAGNTDPVASAGTTAVDSDSGSGNPDGIADYRDLDSDNDGIADTIEARPTAGYTTNDGDVTDNDADGDGVIDLFDANDGTTQLFGGTFTTPEDTDGDLTPDYFDTDSDGDTQLDSAESGLTLSGNDTNGDGVDDDATIGASYTDPDGVIDDPSSDLDNEVGDTTEVGYREVSDKDNDGIADAIDIDTDNDGILDINEKDSLTFQNIIDSTSGWSGSGGSFLTATAGLTPTAGTQFLHFNPSGAGGSRWLDSGEVFAAGTYTFLVDVGNFNNAPFPGSTFAGIRAGTTAAIAGTTVTATTMSEAIPGSGVMLTWSYTLDLTAGDPLIGQTIGFEVGVAGGGNSNVAFDNLRIISDNLERDSDSDSVGDFCDLDSDNDGISDLLESGSVAGISADTNSDGTISVAEAEAVLGAGSADADGDGLMDMFDADTGDTDPAASVGTIPVDSDSGLGNPDSIADYLDLDSDNDGIADTIEARPTAGYTTNDGDVTDNDADGDGVIDQFDANDGTTQLFGGTFTTPEDTDGDLTPDYIDTDSDDDTQLDSAESGLTLSGNDANGDGIDDDASIGASFTDPDGVLDDPSSDLDNEVGDTTEVGYREVSDKDNDGIANAIDIDDDNDGILDGNESTLTPQSVGTDLFSSTDATTAVNEANLNTLYGAGSHTITTQVLNFTGSDQVVTAPAGAVGMRVLAWGAAGGGHVGFFTQLAEGGAGGFTEAVFNVTGGEQFTVVVGEGGDTASTNSPDPDTYGWGQGGLHDQGGGLSGIFSGTAVVTAADQARALAIAGGGGSVDHIGGSAWASGTNGNHQTDSGGVVGSFLGSAEPTAPNGAIGFTPENWSSSGGGGYEGGGRSNYAFGRLNPGNQGGTGSDHAAQGGSGFVSGSAVFGSIEYTDLIAASATNDNAPPRQSDPNYVAGIGVPPDGGQTASFAGGNGLVVIEWVIAVGGGDTDGDGVGNFCDLDSDNDGISDLVESGSVPGVSADTNSDGTISVAEAEAVLGGGNADADGDGLMDIFDADTGNTDPVVSAGTMPVDSDSSSGNPDGIADYRDLDSDNDGIADTIEARPTAGYTTNDGDVTDNDADGDGVIDQFDANDGTTQLFGGTFTTPEDTDGDLTPDYLDTDSDDDTQLDGAESGLTLSGNDANADGIDDDVTIGASYTDPDGVIDNPSSDLDNEIGDTTEIAYREVFAPMDYGDAPDTYGTDSVAGNSTSGSDPIGASHIIDSNLYIGPTVPDTDSDGFVDGTDDTGNAGDDDAAAAPGNGADEGGITLGALLTSDSSYSVDLDVVNTNTSNVTLIGWIDFDQSGTFDADEEAILTGVLTGTQTLNWTTIPTDITASSTFARFRLSSDSLTENDATGAANDGEVEDYQLTITSLADFGDAPDTTAGTGVGDYQTLSANGGPSHTIVSGLTLGALVDDESEGQQSANADGDDSNGDDEDAFSNFTGLTTALTTYSLTNIPVTNTTGSTANLVGWIDFDRDGAFDADEAATTTVADNDTLATLAWSTIPGDIAGGLTYARFRLSTDAIDGNSSTGAASNGEVEDYPITITDASTAVCGDNTDDIGGIVFLDSDANGVLDTGESGSDEIGMTISAYEDDNDTPIVSVGVAGDGTYVFPNLGVGGAFRLELTGLPSGFAHSGIGANAGSGVQFVNGADCTVDFGIHNPLDFCGNNPAFAISCFVRADVANPASTDTIIPLKYSNGGPDGMHVDVSDTGSVWGLAFSSGSQSLYSASFIKGFSAMGSATSTGVIYVTDYSDRNTPITNALMDLNTVVGIDTGTPTTFDPTQSGYFIQVGKMGVGGLTLSPDEQTLYAINLNQKAIVSIPVGNPTAATQTVIPDPGCAGGDYRPFALTENDGSLYIGVTCTAETSGLESDVEFFVTETDLTLSSFATTLNIPNYQRVIFAVGTTFFVPWNDAIAAGNGQGWLTDIEFVNDGSMVLAILDRANGHMFSENLIDDGFGDLLFAYNNNGTFELENNGQAGPHNGCGIGSGSGPGNGEFYCSDHWRLTHLEVSIGSVLYLSGQNDLISAVFDPCTSAFAAGLHWYDWDSGAQSQCLEILPADFFSNLHYGKAANFGDMELMCDSAPVEIGNRIWNDADADGIQDPSEAGLAGITVQLIDTDGSTVLAAAVTDASGTYLFSSGLGSATASFVYDISGLLPNTAGYIVRVNTTQVDLGGGTLSPPNNDPSTNGNLRDSDGVTNGNFADATIATGAGGVNDHDNADFGFFGVTLPASSSALAITSVSPGPGILVKNARARVIERIPLEEETMETTFSIDVDEGAPPYQYTWVLNGNVVGDDSPSFTYQPNFETVDHPRADRDVTTLCLVKDTEANIAIATWEQVNVKDLNRHPRVTTAEINAEPSPIGLGSILTAIAGGWEDADNDPPGYHYQWIRNGTALLGATDHSLQVGNEGIKVGDTITVTITPFDGFDSGPSVTSDSVAVTASKNWIIEIKASNTDTQRIAFGMNEEATDQFDFGLDSLAAAAAPESTVGRILLQQAENNYLRDTRPISDTAQWLLVVIPNGNSVELSWTFNTLPEGRYLSFFEVDSEGNPIAGPSFPFHYDGELTVDQGNQRYFRIRYASELQQFLSLEPGWSLISLPIVPTTHRVDQLFMNDGEVSRPDSTRMAWGYQDGQYYQTEALLPVRGYWVFMERETVVPIKGLPISASKDVIADKDNHDLSIVLENGWNLFGPVIPMSITYPILPPLNGCVWTLGGLSYKKAYTIEPGKGYWLYSNESEFKFKLTK